MPADPWLALGALAAEAAVGYPRALQRRVPHPVVWAGSLIDALEHRWNRPAESQPVRRALGVATLVIVAGAAAGLGALAEATPAPAPISAAVFVTIATTGLAQRSLYEHVAAVRRPLAASDLEGARTAVGMIVGRDTAALNEAGVAAAAIESLAESFNDGIVAPAFWLLVGGLPGLLAYKAVNTADSLIGHREERWRSFGWAAARTDDLMNLIPARLAGGLIALAGRGGWKVMLRDAPKHASPNAGWPEAAMAGALRVQLGGPAAYDAVLVERPSFGDGPTPQPADLTRALRLYVIACGLLWAMFAIGGLPWPR